MNIGKKSFTEPILPRRVIVAENGVSIEHYYRSGDHTPAHLHVIGRGPKTEIQQNGHPRAGHPELSTIQRKVVKGHKAKIRRAVHKIYRWLKYHESILEYES